MDSPRRKQIRLAAQVYREEGQVFSITLGTSPRAPVFKDQRFGLACIRALADLRREIGNPVYAYCLMPDHVHLLIGVTATTPLSVFLGRWKSLCYKARRESGEMDSFWQRGYFDHAMREDEDLRQAAFYILMNPVRKGLVEDFRRYPLCGSLEWEIEGRSDLTT